LNGSRWLGGTLINGKKLFPIKSGQPMTGCNSREENVMTIVNVKRVSKQFVNLIRDEVSQQSTYLLDSYDTRSKNRLIDQEDPEFLIGERDFYKVAVKIGLIKKGDFFYSPQGGGPVAEIYRASNLPYFEARGVRGNESYFEERGYYVHEVEVDNNGSIVRNSCRDVLKKKISVEEFYNSMNYDYRLLSPESEKKNRWDHFAEGYVLYDLNIAQKKAIWGKFDFELRVMPCSDYEYEEFNFEYKEEWGETIFIQENGSFAMKRAKEFLKFFVSSKELEEIFSGREQKIDLEGIYLNFVGCSKIFQEGEDFEPLKKKSFKVEYREYPVWKIEAEEALKERGNKKTVFPEFTDFIFREEGELFFSSNGHSGFYFLKSKLFE